MREPRKNALGQDGLRRSHDGAYRGQLRAKIRQQEGNLQRKNRSQKWVPKLVTIAFQHGFQMESLGTSGASIGVVPGAHTVSCWVPLVWDTWGPYVSLFGIPRDPWYSY